MGKVIAQASMSLDGFIADTNDQAGPLFDWYYNGNVEVTGTDFHTSPASAGYLRAAWSAIGADVIGRRLFDLTNGWNGRPVVPSWANLVRSGSGLDGFDDPRDMVG